MSEPVAKRELVGVNPDGERYAITVTVGLPYPLNDVNGDWRCSVSVAPLTHRTVEIAGIDSLQALSLAISYAHFELRNLVERGGRILYPDTDEDPETDVDYPLDGDFLSRNRPA